MDKKDIKDLIQWHVIATERAIQAGFDIIYCYAGMGFCHIIFFIRHSIIEMMNMEGVLRIALDS